MKYGNAIQWYNKTETNQKDFVIMVAAYESQVAYSVRVQCEQERVDDIFTWLEETFPDLSVDVGDPFARVGEVFVSRPYEVFSGESDLASVDEAESHAVLVPVSKSVKQEFSGLEVSGPAWHTFVVYI